MTRITPEILARIRRLPLATQYAVLRWLRQTVPPPGADWPAISEQVWKGNAYLTKWGGWNVPQTAYGKEWGATGEGPGYLNGPILSDGYGQGLHVGKLLDNCRVLGLGETPTNKWCERTYNQINPVRRKCEYLGHVPEHYLYWSVLQGGLIEDVRFGKLGSKNAQGAAVQVALRNVKKGGHDYTMETQQPELSQVESTRIYRRCEFNHIGDPLSPRWGAFTISEHYAELLIGGIETNFANTHVRIEGGNLTGGHINWQDGNGKLVQSARGFLIQGRPSFTMTGFSMDNPNPYSGWAGRINSVPTVEIGKSEIRDGKVEIVDPNKVRLYDNKGNAVLSILKGGLKVYEGPISQALNWSAA